jgi:hypothetical protein
MTAGALPKGYEKGQRTAQLKKSGSDKTGLAIVIGMIAVAIIIGGLAYVGVIPGFENMQEQTTTVPVMQEKPSTSSYTMPSSVATGSYASSTGDVIDQLDFKITTGYVKSMHLDNYNTSLVIDLNSVEDGELFIALDENYIGSDDGTFFIIVGGEETNDYEQAGNDLFILFPAGTEKIEIFGSYVVS